MKQRRNVLLLAAAMMGVFALSAVGQDIFSDPNADYSFSLPDAKWKLTTKPTAALPNADFVYGDRADGLFEVRRLTVPRDQVLSDLIHGGEEAKLSFRPGFVAGKDENFSGRYRGTVFNYEYVGAGRPMAGRSYYLRVNETTVYLLKFSGPKDNIRSLRAQMDSIARTFSVK